MDDARPPHSTLPSHELPIPTPAISFAALKRPDATEPRRLLFRYVVPITAIHVAALLCVVPWFFSWTGVILCLIGVHLFGQAITMGYHRLLAHRSFVTSLWFERLLVVMALCSLEDAPARWVATHRMHHAHSDEREDPHSPLVSFLWGHVGWLFLRNHSVHSASAYERYARDLLRDPFYMWLERRPFRPLWFYLGHAVLLGLLGFGLAAPLVGIAAAAQLAASVVVWGVLLRTVLVWHITWSVNSLTHLFGYRNHDTEESSRNNWLVAVVAAGEGWHNNHHADPACCSVRHRWWELDVTYLEIRALKLVGLVRSVVPRREVRIAEWSRRAMVVAGVAGESAAEAAPSLDPRLIDG